MITETNLEAVLIPELISCVPDYLVHLPENCEGLFFCMIDNLTDCKSHSEIEHSCTLSLLNTFQQPWLRYCVLVGKFCRRDRLGLWRPL